ncbi:MAG: bifunctional hydroxymethylpyrimidine kinase/phosphomethylpyrimidine kinase, partial [Sterolibacterium sp.]
DEDMVDAMIELLLPQTTIITPNSLEARRLTLDEGQEEPEDGEEESQERTTLIECARRLIVAGSEFVLITGTHENTEQVVNTLYGSHGVVRSDKWERLPGSYHGSGCTLASAIAANLANGLEIAEAVKDAQEYTWQALAAGFRPGMGQHLPDRFFWARDDAEDDASRGS